MYCVCQCLAIAIARAHKNTVIVTIITRSLSNTLDGGVVVSLAVSILSPLKVFFIKHHNHNTSTNTSHIKAKALQGINLIVNHS